MLLLVLLAWLELDAAQWARAWHVSVVSELVHLGGGVELAIVELLEILQLVLLLALELLRLALVELGAVPKEHARELARLLADLVSARTAQLVLLVSIAIDQIWVH